jgi:MFS transporter, NNP family, nitrate/nitrite transporter
MHRATAGGIALGVAVGWNVSNIGAIADSLALDYGVSLTTVGLFTTALFVVHAVLQIPSGRLVDRFGARRIGLGALAILAVANGIALIAPDPGLALGARSLAGVGTALGFVAGIDYVRAQGGSSFAQGLYGGLALGAGGAALAIVPQVEDWIGWRAPYASAFVLAALGAIVLATGPADRKAPAATDRRRRAAGRPGLLRDPRLYRLCLVYAASFGLSVVLGNWVVTLLERAGGYSSGVAGAVGSFVLLGGIVSRPLGGFATRRYPDRVRAILAASFVVSGAGTLILAAAGSPPLSLAGALLLGLAAGLPFAASFGAAARVRPEAPAAAIGMVNMAANLVIVAATPLIGLTFSLPGDGRIGFLAATALWLAALLVLPAVRELDSRPRPVSLPVPPPVA